MELKYKILGLFLLVIFLLGCTQAPQKTQGTSDNIKTKGETGDSPQASGMPVIPDEKNKEVAKDTEATKEFDIEAFQWGYNPSAITVKKGDKVKITLTTRDVSHGFKLEEFGVNEKVSPGKTTLFEFTADKAGTFVFRCSVPCGEGHSGMEGTLIVEE